MADETTAKKKVSILAVDDEDEVRNLYATILSEEGYRVVTASRGGEAVEKAENEKFDLMLLDIKMPDMTGIDVLKKLKGKLEGTLVIIVTAYPSVESTIEAIRTGVYDYIIKPFSPKDLRVVVRMAAEKGRLIGENKILVKKLEQANSELREKLYQLEKFTKIATGREERMAELKEKIRQLEEELKKR